MKRTIEAPYWWQNLSRALRFMLATLVLVFSTSSIYPQSTNMKIIFWFGIIMVLIQTVDIFLGTKKVKNDDSEVEIPSKN